MTLNDLKLKIRKFSFDFSKYKSKDTLKVFDRRY